MINRIMTDVNSRLPNDNVKKKSILISKFVEVIRKIGNKTIVKDGDFAKLILGQIDHPLLENTGIAIEDSVNILCNRIEAYGHGILQGQKKNKDLSDTLRKLKDEIAKKAQMEEVKDLVRKKKNKLKTKVGIKLKVL